MTELKYEDEILKVQKLLLEAILDLEMNVRFLEQRSLNYSFNLIYYLLGLTHASRGMHGEALKYYENIMDGYVFTEDKLLIEQFKSLSLN